VYVNWVTPLLRLFRAVCLFIEVADNINFGNLKQLELIFRCFNYTLSKNKHALQTGLFSDARTILQGALSSRFLTYPVKIAAQFVSPLVPRAVGLEQHGTCVTRASTRAAAHAPGVRCA
jgi:hypothetical protein